MQFVIANAGLDYLLRHVHLVFILLESLVLGQDDVYRGKAEKGKSVSGFSERKKTRGPGRLTAFEDVRVRDVLLGRHLGALHVPKSDRSRVCLEPRDCSGLASLANDIDGLSDADGSGQELVRLVRKRNQESLPEAEKANQRQSPCQILSIALSAKETRLTGYMAIVRK